MKLESECMRKMLRVLILTVGIFVEKVSLKNVLPKPVPFGHIFRDGIDDLASDDLRPIDLLELSMRFPKTEQEEKRLLRTSPRKVIRVEPFRRLINPRDKYMEEALRKKGEADKYVNTTHNERPQWFDFETILRENIEGNLPKPQMKSKFRSNYPTRPNSSMKSDFDKFHYFSHDAFDIPSFNADRLNWTTCEEFEKDIGPNNVVYPKDIVDIEWEPFYIWNPRKFLIAVVHKFTYPTKKIVHEYRDMYGKFLPTTFDWEQPKLVLKERTEMLLIAGDRKGLFHAIPRSDIPLSIRHKNLTIPTLDIRLKIVDPYLALMYCGEFYATIMASTDNVPRTDEEKTAEAALLKFKGLGYTVSRDLHFEKLKIKGKEDQKRKEEERKIIKALPGYPGIDDIDDLF